MKKRLVRLLTLVLCVSMLLGTMSNIALAAQKVKLNKTSVSLMVGESTQLKLKGSSIKSAKSSNKKVATVNKKGKVTAKKKGKTTITVTGKNGKKYKCKVTVKKNKLELSPFVGKTSNIELDDGSVGLTVYSNGRNYDIYFGRWVTGLSASAEDFNFTTKSGKNSYKVTGNRNNSKYVFDFSTKKGVVEIKVKRIYDQWNLIPEKTYKFKFS